MMRGWVEEGVEGSLSDETQGNLGWCGVRV